MNFDSPPGVLHPDKVRDFMRSFVDGEMAVRNLETRYLRFGGRERCWVVGKSASWSWQEADEWCAENIGSDRYCSRWVGGSWSLWFIFPEFKDAVLFAMAVH